MEKERILNCEGEICTWTIALQGGISTAKLLSIVKKGIEMEEINPRLPLSVNGIPDAKNTLRIGRKD